MKIRPGKILKSLYHMSSAFVADFISNDMMHLRDLLELPHHSTGLCRALLIEALAKRGITCSCLMELIRGQEIKKLSLKDGRLLDNETHFVSIVELAGSGLLEIDVRNLTVFQSFATLFSNTPLQSPSKTHYFDSLIRFDARDCLSITDDDIQTLVSILPNLHIFLLAGCLSLTDIAIHFITSSKFMQTSLLEFDISRLELSMEALTSLDALSNIEVLSMAQVVTEASCCSVSPAHRLKGLDMSRSSILTSDHIQEVLSIQMKSLRYLNLAETVVSGSSLLIAFHAAIIACQSLAREAGVVGGTVASACESGDNHSLALDTLDLSWCEQASGEALASLFSYTPHLSRLYLRSSLANSSTVVSLSSACTCLTELNLSRCEEVDDVAAHALAAMSNPQLRWLDISWSLITDDGVSSVLRAHKYIQVIANHSSYPKVHAASISDHIHIFAQVAPAVLMSFLAPIACRFSVCRAARALP